MAIVLYVDMVPSLPPTIYYCCINPPGMQFIHFLLIIFTACYIPILLLLASTYDSAGLFKYIGFNYISILAI